MRKNDVAGISGIIFHIIGAILIFILSIGSNTGSNFILNTLANSSLLAVAYTLIILGFFFVGQIFLWLAR